MGDSEELLRRVPQDGTAIGNVTLQRELGWSDERYTRVREELLKAGQLVKSAGRGGAVRRSGAVKDDELLLSILPKDGATLSKSKILERVRWDEDRYYAVRERLVDTGFAIKGVGRGGTLRLAAVVQPTAPRTKQRVVEGETEHRSEREEQHYGGLAKTLRAEWFKDRAFTHADLEITAKQGRRETGGKWSRPDLTAVSLTRYRYIPGTFLDVTTFEVKLLDALDVTAVYEALAHRRSATRAYLLCIAQKELSETESDRVSLVEDEAARHGVGLFLVRDVDDYETWHERTEAARVEVDPERVNEFIARQLSSELQQDILEWLRGQ